MILVGLTGGIGSGKSTVSAALAERGALVIDADAIVKELQRRGAPVFEAMVAEFGDEIVGPGGELDRPAIAEMVFGDSEALRRLTDIVHPAVNDEITQRLETAADTDRVVILDVPLLVESGRDDMAGTIVVDLPVDIATQRLVEHRGMDPDDVAARMERQVDRTERLAHADHVIDNSGDRAALEPQISRAWEWIEGLRR